MKTVIRFLRCAASLLVHTRKAGAFVSSAIARMVNRLKEDYTLAKIAFNVWGYGAFRAMARGELGAMNVDTIIYVFIAIVIVYQLIPTISGQNTTVQNSANVSAMGKFAAGLGEWLFPLFGLLALVFMLWKKRGKKGV